MYELKIRLKEPLRSLIVMLAVRALVLVIVLFIFIDVLSAVGILILSVRVLRRVSFLSVRMRVLVVRRLVRLSVCLEAPPVGARRVW